VFDDSFNHEVWHDGRETRWVLLIDFWHPDLTVPEQRALTRLNHLFSRERRLRRELLSRRVVP
jgi:aspartate beta-hydroxylase